MMRCVPRYVLGAPGMADEDLAAGNATALTSEEVDRYEIEVILGEMGQLRVVGPLLAPKNRHDEYRGQRHADERRSPDHAHGLRDVVQNTPRREREPFS
jgi:hypothetical protein